MQMVCWQFYEWLQKHDIDPDNVVLKIECADRGTEAHIEKSIQLDFEPAMHTGAPSGIFRDFKIHGIRLKLW